MSSAGSIDRSQRRSFFVNDSRAARGSVMRLSNVTLAVEARDLREVGTHLYELPRDRSGSAWALASIAEDVDVGRRSLELTGLDREQRHHQSADEAPARSRAVERMGDLDERSPKLHRIGIADVNGDRLDWGAGCAHGWPSRAASSRSSNSEPTRADRESG
jgi:hypothetical protein